MGTCLDSNKLSLDCTSQFSYSLSSDWTPQYSNLIAHYKFDGDYADATGNGYTLTSYGGPIFNVSDIGNGELMTLDGNGDYADTLVSTSPANNLTWSSDITFSMWIRFATTQVESTTSQNIMGTLGIPSAYIGRFFINNHTSASPGIVSFTRSNGSTSASTTSVSRVDDGAYHMITGVKSGNLVKIFVDGALEQVMTDISSVAGSLTSIRVGNTSIEPTGDFDEVSIWSTGLTDQEVLSLYNRQKPKFSGELSSSWTPHYDKLVGYWKMDGNWQDSSGNGNHGTANGDATFSTDSRVGSQAGTFDGVGDNIDLGQIQFSSSSIGSACIRFRTDDSNLTQRLFSRGSGTAGNDFALQINASALNAISGLDGGGLVTQSGGMITTGTWTHACLAIGDSRMRAYINGIQVVDTAVTSISSLLHDTILGARKNGNEAFVGSIDELAFFDSHLSHAQISFIYNRQKQKYAGHYESPVIDLGSSGSWTSLTTSTGLPFGKEIVAQSSESSSDYAAFSGDLSNGMVGYWPLNESFLNTIAGKDFQDKSTNINHAHEVGGVSISQEGILSRSVSLDGVDDFIEVDHDTVFDFGTSANFSISGWVKFTDSNSQVLVTSNSSGGVNFTTFMHHNWIGKPRALLYNGASYCTVDSSITINDGLWHHLLFVFKRAGSCTTSEIEIYIDGNLDSSRVVSNDTAGSTNFDITNSENLYFGIRRGGGSPFEGFMDEVAIWNRDLTPTEVQQLYRRGANRVKYQIKSCVDSSCECKSFNTSPVGSASDCDGDGTPNATDYDDSYKAEFMGPGGNGVTSFSELFNRDSSNMTFTCNTNTTDSDNDICVDDEITLVSNPKATSPSFSFADFPDSARPLDNRYFQYRVMMEAEENTTCGGEPCLPELTSVEVGPTGRYFSGSPSVVNKTSQPLDRALSSLAATSSNGCNMNYQISNDGSTFYHWDGASWTSGSNVSESNDLTTLNSNISSFTDQIGLGDFFFRSYLGNSNFSECELDKVQVNKTRP